MQWSSTILISVHTWSFHAKEIMQWCHFIRYHSCSSLILKAYLREKYFNAEKKYLNPPWCPASAGCCCMVSSPPPRAPPCTSTPPCCPPCWCSTGASAASPGSCPSGSGLTDPCWGGSHWGGGCYWRSCSRDSTEGSVIVRVMTKIYSCVLNLFHCVHFNCFCWLGCVSRVKILTLAKTWRIDGDRHDAWTLI